ncbi:WD repeat-containing protein 44-like [Oryza brachyantha]|uniref:Uncharacterized protein n=1 Tax=Oryza brachyantha TaxID=4533 RepID=J3LXR5_ORYBR|nr:WD repeat-containing protein 44-like [Oryza brachyantha]XP_015691665.1 WD repeat-containing protein 44-like [Oryza brachyantha]
MPRSESDRDDIFFDAFDDISSTREPSLSDDCSTSDEGLASRRFEYDIWANEPISVEERRQKFLKGMGFDEFVATKVDFSQYQGEITTAGSCSDLEEGSTRDISSLDSSVPENESLSDGSCCIRHLDNGQRYAVQNDGYGELTSVLKEVASHKVMSLLEFEGFPGISQSVQKLLRKLYSSSLEEKGRTLNGKKKGIKSLCKSFVKNRSFGGICKYDVNVKSCTTGTPSRTRVQYRKKKIVEFSAVQLGQEIQAHKGIIKVMKFSPSGWYLATGGEDCVVRIWQIMEVETSSKLFGDKPYDYEDKITVIKTKLGRGQNHALAVLPKKAFRISETPLHEFQGHTDDILDMAWSKSDHLLTSSKDKTVRLWKVGCDGCLALFKHKDYVTCVQFNPIDERYFISGSVDGKVRVWDAMDKRVVDWVDTRKIITALSYQPDGKGFIVGTTSGECRFYNQSGDNIQLDKELLMQGKKSAVHRVNSLQLCTSDSSRITITSTGSKIRVADGADIIQKFKGPWNLKALSSPSLTSDGRYLISAGLDSNVYIWNFDVTSIAEQKGEAKSVRSCEKFFSKDVTTAVPWPGVHQERRAKMTPSLTEEPVSSPILHRQGERRSPSARCFTDSMKGIPTWPAEKLPSAKTADASRLSDCLSTISPAWNTVIVTASRDGVIRSYHNYGLPVRL